MGIIKSTWLFIKGIFHRFYFWIPAFLFNPYDIGERLIKPMYPDFYIPWSPDWAPFVLIALIFWAAVCTYHEVQKNNILLTEEERNIVPDMPAEDAFIHIMLYSTFSIGTKPGENGDIYMDVDREMIDKARTGQLKVWARDVQKYPQGFAEALRPIEKIAWSYSHFYLPSMVKDDYGSGMIVSRSNGEAGQMEAVTVNKDQVMKLWPKAGFFKRLCDPLNKTRLNFYTKERVNNYGNR